MTSSEPAPRALHFAPDERAFLDDVLDGLSRIRKELPCKYFYDERGSQLFERICDLPEYYLTRTELAIMDRYVAEMAVCVGRNAVLIEYGSGTSRKTRLLLDHLDDPAAYVPIDISYDHLLRAAQSLREAYPQLAVHPVCADYTSDFEFPAIAHAVDTKAVYFPGSTIGNFEPAAMKLFLAHVADVVGPGGGFLVGLDLQKEAAVIEAAYNDAAGVTARFNLNLLHRINEELGGNFDLSAFAHRAIYDADAGRIEMHLVSLKEQRVRLNGSAIPFREGETIFTESSYKYDLRAFEHDAGDCGFRVEKVWTDERKYFAVVYLRLIEAGLFFLDLDVFEIVRGDGEVGFVAVVHQQHDSETLFRRGRNRTYLLRSFYLPVISRPWRSRRQCALREFSFRRRKTLRHERGCSQRTPKVSRNGRKQGPPTEQRPKRRR
ncbi:MAG: L-histidine N(alpha)-methyltransferase [Deltaproteobacteria bacterium]|nr:L-histidine N(alpha)-methyltransferase [Deltaproteobacteria bacterium]